MDMLLKTAMMLWNLRVDLRQAKPAKERYLFLRKKMRGKKVQGLAYVSCCVWLFSIGNWMVPSFPKVMRVRVSRVQLVAAELLDMDFTISKSSRAWSTQEKQMLVAAMSKIAKDGLTFDSAWYHISHYYLGSGESGLTRSAKSVQRAVECIVHKRPGWTMTEIGDAREAAMLPKPVPVADAAFIPVVQFPNVGLGVIKQLVTNLNPCHPHPIPIIHAIPSQPCHPVQSMPCRPIPSRPCPIPLPPPPNSNHLIASSHWPFLGLA